MNIFIGQQKAEESRRRVFSVAMKASSFVLMTRTADFRIHFLRLCSHELTAQADIVEVGTG